jgi:hypothetical protein
MSIVLARYFTTHVALVAVRTIFPLIVTWLIIHILLVNMGVNPTPAPF